MRATLLICVKQDGTLGMCHLPTVKFIRVVLIRLTFPVPGVHFNTSYENLKNEISTAIRVFAHGAEAFKSDPENKHISLSPSLSCKGLGESAKWAVGERYFRYLKNVTFPSEFSSGKPPLKFNPTGTLHAVELQIMNLRPSGLNYNQLVWEQVRSHY